MDRGKRYRRADYLEYLKFREFQVEALKDAMGGFRTLDARITRIIALHRLEKNSGTSAAAIARTIGRSSGTIRRHVHDLVKAGIVTREPDGLNLDRAAVANFMVQADLAIDRMMELALKIIEAHPERFAHRLK